MNQTPVFVVIYNNPETGNRSLCGVGVSQDVARRIINDNIEEYDGFRDAADYEIIENALQTE